MEREERYRRGAAHLTGMAPQALEQLDAAYGDVAPDLLDMVVAFAFGDVHARPGLDVRERQIAIVAGLAALGNAPGQLRFHVGASLGAGCAPEDLVELMYLIAVFAGFPAALNGLSAVKEVFAERGVSFSPARSPYAPQGASRRERGMAALEATSQGSGQAVLERVARIAPGMVDFLLEFSYGDVISRRVLSPRLKELGMIAAAAARGAMLPQLKVHVAAGLAVGLTREEIVEVLLQMAVYAGFPASLNALFAAEEVFLAREEALA
jgi:4-carboxymuconolactone decarboxylase